MRNTYSLIFKHSKKHSTAENTGKDLQQPTREDFRLLGVKQTVCDYTPKSQIGYFSPIPHRLTYLCAYLRENGVKNLKAIRFLTTHLNRNGLFGCFEAFRIVIGMLQSDQLKHRPYKATQSKDKLALSKGILTLTRTFEITSPSHAYQLEPALHCTIIMKMATSYTQREDTYSRFTIEVSTNDLDIYSYLDLTLENLFSSLINDGGETFFRESNASVINGFKLAALVLTCSGVACIGYTLLASLSQTIGLAAIALGALSYFIVLCKENPPAVEAASYIGRQADCRPELNSARLNVNFAHSYPNARNLNITPNNQMIKSTQPNSFG